MNNSLITVFVAIDGDDVGHQLEYLILTNQLESLTKFFKQYQSAMAWLETKLINEFSATIFFSGGDNLLAKIPDLNDCNSLDDLRNKFAQISSKTLSIGIGKSPRQAMFALQLAKSGGKNCIRNFHELNDD